MEKREKIRRSYDHYKRQITHWEVAILKNTGRKPDKNDLSEAPISIQNAYKEYKKIKKYLETHTFEEEQLRNEDRQQKTPKKIFFTYQGQHSVATAVPDEVYKKLSSKLFMASSLPNCKWGKPLPEKSSINSKSKEPSEQTDNISVTEGEGHISKTSSIFKMTTDEDLGQDCVDGNLKKNFVIPNKTYDRISALWQNPSIEIETSNLFSLGQGGDPIKQVDQRWLERCGSDINKDITMFEGEDDVLNTITTRNDTSQELNYNSVNQSQTSSWQAPSIAEMDVPNLNVSGSKGHELDLSLGDKLDNDVHKVVVITDTNDDVTNVIVAGKRSLSQAFSPSPEKPKPKRKFFKTSREERDKTRMLLQPNKNATVAIGSEVRKKIPDDLKELSQAFTKVSPDKILSESVGRVLRNKETQLQPAVVNRNGATVSTVAINKEANVTVKSKGEKYKRSCKRKGQDIIGTSKSKSAKSNKGQAISTKTGKAAKSNKAGKEKAERQLPEESEQISSSNNIVSVQSKADDVYDEVIQTNNNTKKKFTKMSKKQLLERKVNDGKVNQNFVRIDVTKKVFVRGHKKISGAKVKRMNWKSKQSAAFKTTKSATLTCRKCGETGHFAKFCVSGLNSTEKQVPEQIDDSPFPTLEEAAKMALSKKANNVCPTKVYENSEQSICTDDTVLKGDNKVSEEPCSTQSEFDFPEGSSTQSDSQSNNTVPPYFAEQQSSEEQENLLEKTLNIFGYSEFRDGQKETIIRVLNGLSTLVILSTGSGKSLCYQLPAYLYSKKHPGVLTLCISPLVSLMEDQVQGVPSFFNAACLHNNMTTKQKEVVIDKLKSKKLEVLLVSPEAICGGLFGLLKTGNIPPISFACIDEVHCVSQWSHNFRPSYLQICKILREKLNVKTILGLTATATDQTATSICEHLKIDPSTTIRGELIPRNLNLSVSRDKDRDEALLILLKGERFKECDSIIIYCTRREECENIAKFIRINLQEGPINGTAKTRVRQRISNNCEAYHAGMTAARRRTVQRLFMNGEIRIVVATVAFGMGIDKADIRAVIHYNMPKTFESYVQEIGRAGRDGLPAHCHLFLDNVKGRDLCELKRHVFSNSVDRPTLRKLISRIFKPCKCSRIAEITGENKENKKKEINGTKRCPGHEVSFSVNDTIMELDLPQENIMTLLCYLELDDQRKWIELLPMTYERCKIQSYGGPQLLKSSAQNCPPLAVAIALKREKKKFKDNDTFLEFNVIETAATVGWNSGLVKRELKNLEWKATEYDEQGNGKKFRKAGILVEFSELAFRVEAPGDITDEEADIILDSLHKINVGQEKTQLRQLNRVYQSLFSVSSSNVGDCCDGYISEKSDRLKLFIHDYFQQSKLELPAEPEEPPQGSEKEEEVRRDARNLMFSSQDVQFTGRAIAKIFHGISSPCFPAEHWARNRSFWRRYLNVDFNLLCQIAGQEALMYQ